jgi:DNA polymerase (family 10)
MFSDPKKVARSLQEISRLTEVNGGNPHRARAFANAARVVEKIDGDLDAMISSGEILKLKGIGKGTAAVLEELVAGGKPEVLRQLEADIPAGVREMLGISGLGPKKVRSLWRELGAESLGELEYACRENRLLELAGFGAATQQRVLDGIQFARRAAERRLLNESDAESLAVAETLESAAGIERVVVAGEVRRRCETVGVLDLVVVAGDAEAASESCASVLSGAERLPDGRWTGYTDGGHAARFTIAGPGEAGAAVLWATGSDEHLEALAGRAANRGLRLAAGGLFRDRQLLSAADEEEIYLALGCGWMAPELRELAEDVERAANGSLPELVRESDLRGALHNHTTASDGLATVEEMAAAARELGWSFLGIADHSPVATYANGVDAARLRDQWRQIDDVNNRGEVRVVKGLEADIQTDGDLDIPEGCEGGLEYVVASVHSAFRLARERQTDRIVSAVAHPACRVLGHPTGRLLLARPGYELDLETVLEACVAHDVAVEINASPYRLDLDWMWARRALEMGLKLTINPDAHSIDGLADVRWGLAVARRAGATAADIVNCGDIEEFISARSSA